ncbi:MAG: LysE family transporter, partial [Spirochaetota bacterium]
FIGSVFLCYLGFKTFWSTPAEQAALAKGNGLVGAYASTFFLTLTNPMTILSFAAILAGLGLASTSGSYVSAGILVLDVFVGSAGLTPGSSRPPDRGLGCCWSR